MKKIFDFELFLESLVAGKTHYYFSSRFRGVIDRIAQERDPIAMFIKQSENWKTFQDDITFIDLGETIDTVSFIQVNRLDRMRQNDTQFYKNLHVTSVDGRTVKNVDPIEDLQKYIEKVWKATQASLLHDSWEKQRTQVAIGRFVNRVASTQQITIKSDQLEKFVNAYKAECNKLKGIEANFEIIEGEDIKKYYSINSYEERKGQLFASCMKYDECQSYFNIYIKNPEVCKMLILRGKQEDKIIGRALIWTLTNGKTYMDRQYTNNDADIRIFREYAVKNGWNYHGEREFHDLEVQVNNINYVNYPYMDTMKYYNPKTNILSSNPEFEDNEDWWRLERTDGSYASCRLVWSEFYEDEINAEDAVWVVDEESWIYRGEAIWVESVQAWYAEWNEDDICFSNFEGQYILSEDSVYSETLMDNLTIDRSVEVWITSKKQDWFPESKAEREAELYEIDGDEKICLKTAVVQDKETGEWHFVK